MSLKDRFEALAASTEQTSLSTLEALFDALEPVDEASLIGDWLGGVFRTGHAGEAQLPAMRWAGKRFRGRNAVDPIISVDDAGQRVVNDVMGPASIRNVEYRGVVTATMCYDKHPIFDHFRKIDEDTLLGVMDRKGEDMPLYFYLRRLR